MSLDAAPARAQVLVELRAEARQARVDERQLVAVLDQVAVDVRVAEPVDARGDLVGIRLQLRRVRTRGRRKGLDDGRASLYLA